MERTSFAIFVLGIVAVLQIELAFATNEASTMLKSIALNSVLSENTTDNLLETTPAQNNAASSDYDISTGQLVLQFIIAALAAGSAILTRFAFDWHKRPILEIDKSKSPEPVGTHIDIFKIENPLYRSIPTHTAEYKIPYIANRIIVRNIGRTAAENCKVVLIQNGREEKVHGYRQQMATL